MILNNEFINEYIEKYYHKSSDYLQNSKYYCNMKNEEYEKQIKQTLHYQLYFLLYLSRRMFLNIIGVYDKLFGKILYKFTKKL